MNAGRAVPYATLQRSVWTRHDIPNPNRVRGIVLNLRRKLGDDAADPAYIRNERGIGYRMPRPGDV